MSKTEKIILPHSILSDLYKNVLIDENATHEVPAKKTLEALFIQSEAALGEDAASEELLSGILAACKLNSNNSVVIKASREHPITVQSTQENYTTKKIILFGLRPTEVGLPVEFPHFQVQKIDSIQFICSPDLKELLQDKTLKVKLWNSLKQIFV
jgi:hypothetical protein